MSDKHRCGIAFTSRTPARRPSFFLQSMSGIVHESHRKPRSSGHSKCLYARRAQLDVEIRQTQLTCNPKRRTCSTKLVEYEGGRADAAVLSICKEAGRWEIWELQVQKDTDKTTAPRIPPVSKSSLFWLKFSNPVLARWRQVNVEGAVRDEQRRAAEPPAAQPSSAC